METILYQTLSTDDELRRHATKELERIEKNDFSSYAKWLCDILGNEQQMDSIRLSAGIVLKNALIERSQLNWLLLDLKSRQEVKEKLLELLNTTKRNVANILGQVLAAVARIELPLGEWHALIDILLFNMTRSDNTNTRQTSLQIIGYMNEFIEPEILSCKQSDALITAIIQGARKEELDTSIREAAMVALYNSLEFIKRNFENTNERDYIIKVICDGATQHINSTLQLQISSYECLNKAMQLYYHQMEEYMCSSLFNLTICGITRSDPKISSQAIEFWSTVCSLEIELETKKMHSFFFARHSAAYIMPSLLSLLIKNDEDVQEDEDDQASIAIQAAECTSLFALCAKEAAVPHAIEFINHNLLTNRKSLSWNQKEASIVAFGSIVEGPCKFKTLPLVNQMLPVLIQSLDDSTAFNCIKIAASRTLSQVLKQSISILDVPHVLKNVIPSLLTSLYSKQQSIVYFSCLSIIHIAQELKCKSINPTPEKSIPRSETGPLSMYTSDILFRLLSITQSTTPQHDIKCRNTVYETMSAIVSEAPEDCTELICALTQTLLERLESIISLYKKKEADKDLLWQVQTNLLGVLSNCIYRLGNDINDNSERIMVLVYRTGQLYLNHPQFNTTVVEDTFLLVSAMITATGKKFHRYIDNFLPDLSKILTRQAVQQQDTMTEAETRLSLIGVGIISDISTTFRQDIFPYAGEFMKLLINNLKSKRLHRDVKPATLSCIGDIAQALGPVFVPHVDTVMMALRQAGNMQSNHDDVEAKEYVDAIRVGTLEAFIGMLQGTSQNAATKEILYPYVTDFVFYITSIAMDKYRSDRLIRLVIGLLGDIAQIYGKRMKSNTLETPLNHLVMENSKGEFHFTKETRQMSSWAQKIMIQVYHNSSPRPN